MVITPGHITGMITWRKAWKGVQPSTRAASSSSAGMFSKKLLSIQMVKGWLIATRTAITARGWPYNLGEVSPSRGCRISAGLMKNDR